MSVCFLSRYLDSANHTCGNFAPEIDEIAISGLHTMQSVKVKPARIREAAVQMECQVRSTLWSFCMRVMCAECLTEIANVTGYMFMVFILGILVK